jgi:hypothetical protein
MMVNDDPNKNRPVGGGPGGLAGPVGPGTGAPSTSGPGGDPRGAGQPAAMFSPPGGKYSTTDGDNDVDATFRNVTLQGDFVNTLTAESGMNLAFENSTITGAITTGTAVHAVGPKGEKLVMQESPDLYYLIGEQTETYVATNGPGGATVSLKAGSKWIVNKTSYITDLRIADDSSVAAASGYKLTMTVDGTAQPIGIGKYKGKIVLKVVAAN